MGAPDTTRLPSRALLVSDGTGVETHDEWMRGFLSRYKSWPFTTAPAARPGSPAAWAIHCDTLATIASGTTTPADYVIWNGLAWVDITAVTLATAIISQGGGATTTALTAAIAAHNATIAAHPVYAAQTTEPAGIGNGFIWKNTSASTVAGVAAGATVFRNGGAWITDPTVPAAITLYTEATTAPTSPVAGQRWKNTSAGTVSGVAAGATAYWSGSAWITEATTGVTDGDKGDITVSSTGTVWTIDPKVVTATKSDVSVISMAIATPPGSPATNDRYVVASSPTGAWAGQANSIATYTGAAWSFTAAYKGLVITDSSRNVLVFWNGTVYQDVPTNSTAPTTSGLRANSAGSQSLSSGAYAVLTDLTTIVRNDYGASYSSGALTIPTGQGGWYNLSAAYKPNAGTSTLTGIEILVDSVAIANFEAANNHATAATDYYLNESQVVSVRGKQTTGSSQVSSALTFLSVMRTGANASAFVAAGGSHAAGLVPDPGATASPLKVLGNDGAFRTVSEVIAANGPVAFRNIAGRNGGFEVCQRTSPVSVAASATNYTIDGWYLKTGTSQAMTVTKNTGLVDGSLFAAKVQRTSGQAGTGTVYFAMPLDSEELALLRGKNALLSFTVATGANWSPTSGTLTYKLYCGTGAVDKRNSTAYTSETNPISGTTNLAVSAAATRITAAVTSSAIGSTVTQAEIQFSWTPTGTAGAADTITFDDVQLEVVAASETIAAPFERAPYAVERNRCMRHYQFYDNYFYGQGYIHANAFAIVFTMKYELTMRGTPTLVQTNATNASCTVGASNISSNKFVVTLTSNAGAGAYCNAVADVSLSAEI